jgi:enoyl-CoA hydratase/carnithine racemase
MTEPTIRIDRGEGVAQITLNRPAKKNAMSRAMWEELKLLLQEVGHNAADRVVILTGAGNDFCAGGDLTEWSEESMPSYEQQLDSIRQIQSTALALFECPKPCIAAIRGVAVGGGFTLALGCDLTVAAANARLGAVFIRRGLVPDLVFPAPRQRRSA